MTTPYSSDRYLDNFTAAYYDISYRSEHGNLSTWVILEYSDAALIDFNISEIVGYGMSREAAISARAEVTVGQQNRLFPNSINSSSAPRLWDAKQAILKIMDDYNFNFIVGTLPAVIFILTMGIGMSASAAPRSRFPRRIATPQTVAAEEGALLGNREIADIVKWGEGTSAQGVAATVARTQSLNRSMVIDMIKKGLNRQSVEAMANIFRRGLASPVKAGAGPQLAPRLQLMERILELWPK
ncbi:hypothetical protein [Variovorax sp. dw_954]|uniref:hypothetical protein n=1 Tax=Variovorax sp. dw_954 TaxID=2720078 RepID=UPI001BD54C2C|nr:hypothetical protein [Variovorax sp. dw_954]